jgi:hypothetical protein
MKVGFVGYDILQEYFSGEEQIEYGRRRRVVSEGM